MHEQTIYNVFTYRMEREISDFGKWIRGKRTEQGLSMRDLAERTNGACSHSYIGQIETGRAGKKGLFRPNLEIVDAIAKALGCPLDEARLAAGYAPQTVTTRPTTIPELVAALEQLGIEMPLLFEGLPDPNGDGFQEIIQRIYEDVELVTNRMRRGTKRIGVIPLELAEDEPDIELRLSKQK